jgi:NEDD8-activating enzyme E1 regulatory subunit
MSTNNKYDRQLRLWGASGQAALGRTCVILVGTSAAGTETLKNLVLPGIGRIYVVDAGRPTSLEAASNFFLPINRTSSDTSSSNNGNKHSRAQVALEYLQELNPDVHGDYQEANVRTVDWTSVFDMARTSSQSSITHDLLVVASDLDPLTLERLARACHSTQIPLIQVVSYGLIGLVRLQSPLRGLFDAKPRDRPPDLRLVTVKTAVPGVVSMYDSLDWEKMDSKEYGHVPYPLVLMRMVKEWKRELPKTFAEKQEFQQFIASMAKQDYKRRLTQTWQAKYSDLTVPASDTDVSSLPEEAREEWKEGLARLALPDNIREAQQFAYLAYTDPTADCLTDSLPQLLEAIAQAPSNPRLAPFTALLHALQEFGKKHCRTPLQGSLPDMTASSSLYSQLQRIYQDHAKADLQEMRSILDSMQPTCTVSDDELATFCQNTSHLDILNLRPLVQKDGSDMETDTPNVPKVPAQVTEDLQMALMEAQDDERPDQSPLLFYIGYQACQEFYERHGRYPGVVQGSVQPSDAYLGDVDSLQECIKQIVSDYGLSEDSLVQSTLLATDEKAGQYATEFARYGNAEVHSIASLIGGVASQEAVKLITGQYVPIQNCYVYNGIASIGGVYSV